MKYHIYAYLALQNVLLFYISLKICFGLPQPHVPSDSPDHLGSAPRQVVSRVCGGSAGGPLSLEVPVWQVGVLWER